MQTQHQHITLLTTNALGFPFLIRHKAIKFTGTDNRPYIIHRTTSGVEILTYKTFMEKRHVIRHKHYPIRKEFDPNKIVTIQNRKSFNWMTNNCEDFASEVIEDVSCVKMQPHSPQRTTWIIVLAIILIAMIIVKKK